jgi:hypothetical protein
MVDRIVDDMDPVLQAFGGGAALAAAFALVKLVLDGTGRRGDRLLDLEERSRGHERDTEQRFERVLQDLVDRAERRVQQQADAFAAEQARRLALEHECSELRASQVELETDYARLWALTHSLLGTTPRTPA